MTADDLQQLATRLATLEQECRLRLRVLRESVDDATALTDQVRALRHEVRALLDQAHTITPRRTSPRR